MKSCLSMPSTLALMPDSPQAPIFQPELLPVTMRTGYRPRYMGSISSLFQNIRRPH